MSTSKIGPSVLVLALSWSFVIGCGEESAGPTAMASPSTATFDRGGVPAATAHGNSGADFHATTCATHFMATGAAVFGPAGGTLAFGTSRLIIPAGALRDTVTITATVPGGDASRVEFQPHGLVFAKATGLQLDTAGCSLDEQIAPTVVYLSAAGEVLETIEAVYDPHWHTIAAGIWHFSGYAIAF